MRMMPIIRTAFSMRKDYHLPAACVKHGRSPQRMEKLNGYRQLAAATVRNDHYFGTRRRPKHLRRRTDLSGAKVRSGCNAVLGRASFRGWLRHIVWPGRTAFLTDRREGISLHQNQARHESTQATLKRSSGQFWRTFVVLTSASQADAPLQVFELARVARFCPRIVRSNEP
jgi:hypothetical protein